jgi:hypothetical protein
MAKRSKKKKPIRRAAARPPEVHVYSSSPGIHDAEFLAHFKPARESDARKARELLAASGLKPKLETASGGLVVRATTPQIETLTKTPIKEKAISCQVNRVKRYMTRRSYEGLDSEAPPPSAARGLGRFLFPVPFQYWQVPSAYPPRVPYYHLHPARDLARLFGVETLHVRGVRGQGIRIVMIDSGFYAHPYYSDRGLHGGTPNITTHAVLGDPDTDELGHGTGIAANVLAIAPECDFHHVKDDDDPLAAMVLARSLNPSIITCSWGWSEGYVHDVFTNSPASGAAEYLHDLETEVLAAIGDGVTVLFASGNGPEPGSWPSSVPGVICVGGAFVSENLELSASSYATSFVSQITQGRVCPDVCGLVGPAPYGLLFALPTQPENELDAEFSAADGTAVGDGWLVASGTSSATPQLAGMAALLLQLHGAQTPAQILARFRGMAVGVHQGQTASGHIATAARPNAATGYGLVTFRRPHRMSGFTGLY